MKMVSGDFPLAQSQKPGPLSCGHFLEERITGFGWQPWHGWSILGWDYTLVVPFGWRGLIPSPCGEAVTFIIANVISRAVRGDWDAQLLCTSH